MTEEPVCCFPPLTRADTRVLVVGSLPSVASLQKGQYYGHPRNAFWPLVFATFGETPTDDWEARKALLLSHRVGLWDAAAQSLRRGSLDAAMQAVVLNDFSPLWKACPSIHLIICNGGKAHTLFRRTLTGKETFTVVRLPSTSPAAARFSFQEKLALWKPYLLDEPCPKEETIQP